MSITLLLAACAEYMPRLTTGTYHSDASLDAQMHYEQPKFNNEIDKFTGLQRIAWVKRYSVGQDFDKFFLIVKKPSKSDGVYGITLSKTNSRHRYLACNSTDWLIDGEIVKPLKQQHDSTINHNPVSVTERIDVFFSANDFKKMSKAHSIEYRVCNEESFFVDDEIQGLRQVVDAAGL